MKKELLISSLSILIIGALQAQSVAKNTSEITTIPKVKTEETKSKPVATAGNNTLYLFAEKMPQFPGGEPKLREYIQKNFKYPKQEADNRISGTSNVSFVVEKDGTLTDVKVGKGMPKGSGCDAEGVRLVKAMPRWKPGIQGGQIVRVQMSMPIIFTAPLPAKQPEPVAKAKTSSKTKAKRNPKTGEKY